MQHSPQPQARPRPVAFWISLALATVILWPLGAIFTPLANPPSRVDAIFVLGPPLQSRINFALELARAGYSQKIILSVSKDGGPFDAAHTAICETTTDVVVECLSPEPSTTLGEITLIDRKSAEENWRSVMIVTFNPHVTRTELYAQRCLSRDWLVVGEQITITPADAVYQYMHQYAGFIRAFTSSRSCA